MMHSVKVQPKGTKSCGPLQKMTTVHDNTVSNNELDLTITYGSTACFELLQLCLSTPDVC